MSPRLIRGKEKKGNHISLGRKEARKKVGHRRKNPSLIKERGRGAYFKI